eukprot:GGOE01050130.1.p1 GENE.GGOE01050130.1~~GGOE01050130.1.p1  ORF type:complete len:1208 (-),score=221.82 GGOE01050130.1:231-3782(-)
MAAPFVTSQPLNGHYLPPIQLPARRLPKRTPLWRIVELPEPKRPRLVAPAPATTTAIPVGPPRLPVPPPSGLPKRPANPFPTTAPPKPAATPPAPHVLAAKAAPPVPSVSPPVTSPISPTAVPLQNQEDEPMDEPVDAVSPSAVNPVAQTSPTPSPSPPPQSPTSSGTGAKPGATPTASPTVKPTAKLPPKLPAKTAPKLGPKPPAVSAVPPKATPKAAPKSLAKPPPEPIPVPRPKPIPKLLPRPKPVKPLAKPAPVTVPVAKPASSPVVDSDVSEPPSPLSSSLLTPASPSAAVVVITGAATSTSANASSQSPSADTESTIPASSAASDVSPTPSPEKEAAGEATPPKAVLGAVFTFTSAASAPASTTPQAAVPPSLSPTHEAAVPSTSSFTFGGICGSVSSGSGSSSGSSTAGLFSFSSSSVASSSSVIPSLFAFSSSSPSSGSGNSSSDSATSALPSGFLFTTSMSSSAPAAAVAPFTFNLPSTTAAGTRLFASAGLSLPPFQFTTFGSTAVPTGGLSGEDKDKDKDEEGSEEDVEREVPIEGDPKYVAVDTVTGEEDETELWHMPSDDRAKLFKFDAAAKEWKDRGPCTVKFLKHRVNGKVRLLMRASEGGRLVANHRPSGSLKPHGDAGMAFTWTAVGDAADGTAVDCQLLIRFANPAVAAAFAQQFAAIIGDNTIRSGTAVEAGKPPAGTMASGIGPETLAEREDTEMGTGTEGTPLDKTNGAAQGLGAQAPTPSSTSEVFLPSINPFSFSAAERSDAEHDGDMLVSPRTPPHSPLDDTTSSAVTGGGPPAASAPAFSFTAALFKPDARPDNNGNHSGGFAFTAATPGGPFDNPFARRPEVSNPFGPFSAPRAGSTPSEALEEGVPASCGSAPEIAAGPAETDSNRDGNGPAPFRFNLPLQTTASSVDTSVPAPSPTMSGATALSTSFTFSAATLSQSPAAFSFLSSPSPFGAPGALSVALCGSLECTSPSSSAASTGLFTSGLFTFSSSASSAPSPELFSFTAMTGTPSLSFAASPAGPVRCENEDDDNAPMPEEETGEPITGPPKLQVVATSTGEEDEVEQWRAPARAKLYRFDAQTMTWKDRGAGDVKFLRHTATGKIRLVMRSGDGNRLLANHRPTGELRDQQGGKGAAFTWTAIGDVAEGQAEASQFMIRFSSSEAAMEFKGQFSAAASIP